jgi:hypothetical protein
LFRQKAQSGADIEDGSGVGFMGRLLARGDVLKRQAMPAENKIGAPAGIPRQQSGADASRPQLPKHFVRSVMQPASVCGSLFMTVQNDGSSLPFVSLERRDMLQNPRLLRHANLAADGREIEHFFSQGAVHIENDKGVSGNCHQEKPLIA